MPNNSDLNWITNYIWGIAQGIPGETEQKLLREAGVSRALLSREILRRAADLRYQPSGVKID